MSLMIGKRINIGLTRYSLEIYHPVHPIYNLFQYLIENYGSHLFKVGDDDNNDNVYMKMKHFLYYSQNEGLKDDSPLYIFDSGFYKKRNSSSKKNQGSLLDDYKVPKYFSEDLFKLTGARRPPYRWLVVGGARSGTG